jgi:methyltransferase (TIGR00027 family)
MPIENVSDTARWVAMYRAMETARPDAIFRDPYAERLAGPKGVEIVDSLKNGRRMAWPMIVRTAVLDELILDRVRNAGVDTVINLAAGLDARAWRLDLPSSLNWFDVDLPAITQYKRELMQGETPRCRYEAIAVDLTSGVERDEVLRRVAGVARSALVVTEGLLVYLTHEQVASLARALHAQPSIRWWLADIASPTLLKFMEKTWGDAVRSGNAPFQFAIYDRAGFFEPLGWREYLFRSGLDEARRLHREMPMAWLSHLMIRLQPKRRREAIRTMNGYMLLERQ